MHRQFRTFLSIRRSPSSSLFLLTAALVSVWAVTPVVAVDEESTSRLKDAATVLSEVMNIPEQGIPEDLLTKAHCIVLVPDLKTAAFVVGGKYGKGFVSCRRPASGGWSAPGAVRIEGGSVGFQIGGSSTDVVMLVMSERGAEKLLSSKFTVGAEASVAAGPVGRSAAAQTDAQLRADILSWSRSRGLFAGVAIEGATLREDLDDNQALYGTRVENRVIVSDGRGAPMEADALMALLNRFSTLEKRN
jgi:lipid-binding SYLF domain-containing protein